MHGGNAQWDFPPDIISPKSGSDKQSSDFLADFALGLCFIDLYPSNLQNEDPWQNVVLPILPWVFGLRFDLYTPDK